MLLISETPSNIPRVSDQDKGMLWCSHLERWQHRVPIIKYPVCARCFPRRSLCNTILQGSYLFPTLIKLRNWSFKDLGNLSRVTQLETSNRVLFPFAFVYRQVIMCPTQASNMLCSDGFDFLVLGLQVYTTMPHLCNDAGAASAVHTAGKSPTSWATSQTWVQF